MDGSLVVFVFFRGEMALKLKSLWQMISPKGMANTNSHLTTSKQDTQ